MIELMILFVLLKRDLTMYSIKKHITDKFQPFSTPSFGAIKPALTRLEKAKALTTSKVMSDGGKLSVLYSVTNDGLKLLKQLMLQSFSTNPLQFISDSKIKLCCASFLNQEDLANMLDEIKSNACLHRANAQKILEDEYNTPDFYQRIVLDNTVCEYNNFISMVEGFEKENGRNG